MTSQQQTVEQLFGEALERDPEERRAFLDAACVGVPEIRMQVDELLLADERAGSFLDKPAVLPAHETLSPTMMPECADELHPPPFMAPMVRFKPAEIIGDRFRVVRFIARGGMGEVYEVEDTMLQNVHVALKIILPQIAGDAGSARRFEQEVLLARKVVHPNLCAIYDISRSTDSTGSTPPYLFMTMKLLKGETLAARLRNGARLFRAESVPVFRQMVAGIGALHDGGVIHRDIKPNNVMLEPGRGELCVTIMDFGLARLHDSETTVLSRGQIAGTPGYIAPELLRGQCPSQATDVFALGVVLHQILTGEHPVAKSHSQSTEPSAMLTTADAPPLLVECVREFLADDPARRLAAFGKARESFDTPASGVRLPAISRRAFAFGGAATAAAVVGGAAWHFDWIEDMMHPIPVKRFVALLNWPSTMSGAVTPMVNGVIDAIADRLARAEAFDHNLFVTTHDLDKDIRSPAQLNEVRDSLGANLVLAASGSTRDDQYHVRLRLLDPSSTRTLREKTVSSPITDQAMLPERAIQAAERLLDVNAKHTARPTAAVGGTKSPEAYTAFQAAETLRKQENETGLDAAIEKYKAAIEADPKYALAHAHLSSAYFRVYENRHDPAAMELARANAETSILLEPKLVEGHLALSRTLQSTGDFEGAERERATALSLDPLNPKTLVNQADAYNEMNRWDDAERTYRKVLKLRPNYWLVYQQMGVSYYTRGKYPEALSAFRTASLAAPGNAMVLTNAGIIYRTMGRLDESRTYLTRSLQLLPTQYCYTALAMELSAEGRTGEAITAALKGVEMDPSYSEGWLVLGDAYSAARGHAEEAHKAYLHAEQTQEALLTTEPKDGDGWMQLALLKLKVGDAGSGTLAMVKNAEQCNAKDVEAQLTKVRIYELMGDRQSALATAAACRKMGATVFQFEQMADLGGLRGDPRFKAVMENGSSATS